MKIQLLIYVLCFAATNAGDYQGKVMWSFEAALDRSTYYVTWCTSEPPLEKREHVSVTRERETFSGDTVIEYVEHGIVSEGPSFSMAEAEAKTTYQKLEALHQDRFLCKKDA